MNKTVNCTLTHKGYNAKDRNNPAGADLRVSDNFSMSGMSNLKIKCDDPTIKFRIREAHNGPTDYDAYNGKYFQSGDVIDKGSNYVNLYISDPKKVDENVSSLSINKKFVVTFEGAIDCSTSYEHYNASDDPASSDMRVSDDFNMLDSDEKLKIITDTDVKFRIRENHSGSTDCDAFEGYYFKRGDTVDPTDYDKLYISDPLKTTEGRVPFVGNFKVWFEKA